MKKSHSRDATPGLVRCDFCTTSPAFRPEAWNQRTCHRCAAAGAPDQSKLEWSEYQRQTAEYLRAKGRRSALNSAAVAMKASPATQTAPRPRKGQG